MTGEGEIFRTKSTDNATISKGGKKGDENGGNPKVQNLPPNESVFAGIPDEDIFEYLAEATERKLLEMVENRSLIPIALYERMLKEKDEQILQEREKVWRLEQQVQEKEKRAR